MKKPAMLVVLALLILFSLFACTGPTTPSSSPMDSGDSFSPDEGALPRVTLNFWSHDTEYTTHPPVYYDRVSNPHTINTVVVPLSEYQIALNVVLMSNDDNCPDIIQTEVSFYQRYLSSDMIAPLSDVGISLDDLEAAGIYAYLIENSVYEGELKALPAESVAGTWIYRRSVAKEYLDVDTPEQMAELIKDWNTVLDTARKLKEASGGKAVMFPGFQDWQHAMMARNPEPYIRDGIPVFSQEIYDFWEFSYTVFNEKLIPTNRLLMTPSWYEAIRGESDVQILGTFGAPWVLSYQIGEMLGGPGKTTYGDWAITLPPTPFYMGGSYMMIPANSKKKMEAAEFLRWYCLDTSENGFMQYMVDINGLPASGVVNERNVDGFSNPVCDGQNTLAVLMEASSMNYVNRQQTVYDIWCTDYFSWPAWWFSEDVPWTVEEAAEEVRAYVIERLAGE